MSEENPYKLLDAEYEQWRTYTGCSTDKAVFLSDVVFEFTTYDDDISREWVVDMIAVIECICQKKTFEFIENPLQYRKYLMMVNMPFLADKLEWGGSIRGAWIDNYKPPVTHAITPEITIQVECTERFLKALVKWFRVDFSPSKLALPSPSNPKQHKQQ